MGPSLDHHHHHFHRWSTSSSPPPPTLLSWPLFSTGWLAGSSLPWLWAHRWIITTINSTSLALGIIIIAGAPLHHLYRHQLFSSGLYHHHRGSTSSPPPPSTRLARVWTSSPPQDHHRHLITLTTIDSTCSSSIFSWSSSLHFIDLDFFGTGLGT
ncbi:hypothetical protein TYRP_006158 [Tyrophagus putrescentiae]|nr:hypothetical protein TYRP_006158 [Tyrophagus putrescentiae]